MDISLEGLVKSNQIGVLCEADTDVVLLVNIPGVRSYQATFAPTSMEIGADVQDATTLSASFQSSGPITFAAAVA
jgi:hypothetical protein